MNNNLLQMLSSILNGNFGTNSQMPNLQNSQNYVQNDQSSTNPKYAKSFPEEAYQNQDLQNNNSQNSMSQNMLSLLASIIGKNNDYSSLSSIFTTTNNTDKSTEKKSSPSDDEIII